MGAMTFRPACWDWPIAIPLNQGDITESTSPALRSIMAEARRHPQSQLEAWHAGRCGFCGRNGGLVLDHDHATGLVRGYLCRSCNGLEGFDTYGRFAQTWSINPPVDLLGLPPMEYLGYGDAETITESEATERKQRAADEREARRLRPSENNAVMSIGRGRKLL